MAAKASKAELKSAMTTKIIAERLAVISSPPLPRPRPLSAPMSASSLAPSLLRPGGIGLFWWKGKTGRSVLVCAGLLAAVAVYRFFLRSMFC
jgi:hypothetical protein